MSDETNIATGAPATGGTGTPHASGGAPGGTPTTGASGSGTPPATNSWRDSLPDTLKNETTLANFKSVEDLAKSYVHASAMVGKDKVVIPTAQSSQDEWDAFYAKAGRPESSDKYGLKVEGMDDVSQKELFDTAYKAGMNQNQLKALVEWSDKKNKAQMEDFNTKRQLAQKDAKDKFIKELGGEAKYKEAFSEAAKALSATADDEFKAFLKDTGLGADPRIIKFFNNLANRMKEDGIKGHGGVTFGSQLKEMEDKLKGVYAQPGYYDGNHASHKLLVDQAFEINKAIAEMKMQGK